MLHWTFVSPICDVGVLWPNAWTDQDETWHASRPRPWPHCVRWGPSSPPQKGSRAPNFWPLSIVAKRSPILATTDHLLNICTARLCIVGGFKLFCLLYQVIRLSSRKNANKYLYEEDARLVFNGATYTVSVPYLTYGTTVHFV